MNNTEFLEKYHQMVNDIINAPKIIKNVKQGDTIWYLTYLYKANHDNRVSLSLKHYEVSELTEYNTSNREDPFDVESFYLHVYRKVKKKIIYSTSYDPMVGKWQENIESDSIGYIHESYLKYINKETYSDDEGYPYYTLHIYGFDKAKVLEELRRYEGVLCKNDKNRIEKFIESQLKKKPIDETSKFDILTDDEVITYFNHPSCKNMTKWFRHSWDTRISREENVLNILKFIMITGQQKTFREKLNAERQIKTSEGVIDLNEVAKKGKKDELNEVIEFIEDKDLISDIEWKIRTKWSNLPIYLVYKNKDDKFTYEDLSTFPNHSSPTIFYKKIFAVVRREGDTAVIKTSKEDILEELTSRTIYNPLVNINYL